MTRYRTSFSDDGFTYEVEVDGEWKVISEDEARARGVWQDARVEHIGVHDDMATPEDLVARDKGHYDPRPASGAFVARRVRFRCARCGAIVGHVDEHERRLLFHSVRTQRWTRSLTGMKHAKCYGPLETYAVDLATVDGAVERARHTGKLVQLKIGAPIG